jgi:hypothetical protein
MIAAGAISHLKSIVISASFVGDFRAHGAGRLAKNKPCGAFA